MRPNALWSQESEAELGSDKWGNRHGNGLMQESLVCPKSPGLALLYSSLSKGNVPGKSHKRIIESLRLEKTSKIKSNGQPNTTMPDKPCPEW